MSFLPISQYATVWRLSVLALAMSVGFSACGEGQKSPHSPLAQLQITTPAGFEAGVTSVTGRVTLQGTPARGDIIIDNAGDAYCRAAGPMKTENWKVSESGGLAEAIIEVVDAPATYPILKGKISQEKCRFIPHVAVAMQGQTLEVTNEDSTFHNVRVVRHQMGTLGKGKNMANYSQPLKGSSNEIPFLESGIYRLECDVHRWMQGWVFVGNNDHMAISESDGNYNLKRALKDGTYTVRAWHPQFAQPLEQKVEIKNGQAIAHFTFIAADALE